MMDNGKGIRPVRMAVGFEEAVEAVREALAAEGFGVLTEIDVAATLRGKLGVELPPQLILGACNPPLAYRALQADPDVAQLLPCNVVVRQDGDEVVVQAADPALLVGFTGNPELEPVATEAAERLGRALEALG
jgi:uncharacterized protein (DUF302 family)